MVQQHYAQTPMTGNRYLVVFWILHTCISCWHN
jgi:hypothetical protein